MFGGYLGLLADIAEGRHAELIVFSDLLSLAPPQRDPMAAAYTQMYRRVRGLLDAADAPPLAPAARNARAHLLLSTLSWARAWLSRHEPVDYARVATQIADIVLFGLAKPGMQVAEVALSRRAHALTIDEDDGGATRAAYLRAATRLVNEYGYQGASVDRIAAELRLTKGSFYHHHETKEELIAACFERTFAVMRAAQSAALATQGSGLDRLAMACRSLLDYQMSPQGPLLRVTAWTGLPAALRDDTRRTMGRLGERFAALVVDGMADGSLRIVDPSIAAASGQRPDQRHRRTRTLGARCARGQCVRAVCDAAVQRLARRWHCARRCRCGTSRRACCALRRERQCRHGRRCIQHPPRRRAAAGFFCAARSDR